MVVLHRENEEELEIRIKPLRQLSTLPRPLIHRKSELS
jgi:hypothetical protein